jgi:hypothetical protein
MVWRSGDRHGGWERAVSRKLALEGRRQAGRGEATHSALTPQGGPIALKCAKGAQGANQLGYSDAPHSCALRECWQFLSCVAAVQWGLLAWQWRRWEKQSSDVTAQHADQFNRVCVSSLSSTLVRELCVW